MVWKVVNISDTGTASKFGADDTDKINKLFSAVDVDDVDINADWKFRSGKLQQLNPAATFKYTITPAAIAADRTLNLPLTTATDTLATLGLAQTFTEIQTIKKNLDGTLLNIQYDNNTISNEWYIDFVGKDSASNTQVYARLLAGINDNTNGSEDGYWGVTVPKAGSLGDNALYLDENALTFSTTGANYANLNTNNLTGDRDIQFPNTSTTLAGVGATQTFTSSNTFNDQTLKLRNPANTFSYTLVHGAITANANLTLPLAAGTLPVTISQSGATVDINTTSSETDMLNVSIPANALGANGSVRFTISGYLLQNQASGTTYTFILKFGGTNLISCISPSVAQSATKLPYRLVGELQNKNATNANSGSMNIVVNDTTAITTGIGSIANDTILFSGNSDSEGADTTKDTTSAQTLQVTVTMSVNNAATHTVVKHKMVELINA